MNDQAERKLLREGAASMQRVMSAPFEWFEQFGTLHGAGKSSRFDTQRHLYVDRGSDVLAVAHLDSVQRFSGFWMNHEYICCATIDNRLGAWLALYGLPAMGIQCDVLLTENEERGSSTAQDFVAGKEYNWAFSFDRSGTDVACYQYYDSDLEALLKPYELDAAHGSYSDVADLDLGVKGLNFGCGMYNYHSEMAYAKVDELVTQLQRFEAFYVAHNATRLEHEGGGRYDWWDDESYWRTGYALTQVMVPHSNSWGYYTSHQANKATENPAEWFEGFDTPEDWHDNHSLGDINTTEYDDESIDLFCDGYLVICQECENLFSQHDTDKYTSPDAVLCRACFHVKATEAGFPKE